MVVPICVGEHVAVREKGVVVACANCVVMNVDPSKVTDAHIIVHIEIMFMGGSLVTDFLRVIR